MRYHYVYITVNLINANFYIGKHSSLKINDNYSGSGTLIKAAIRKYGRKNFKTSVLVYCLSEEAAYSCEEEIVNEFLNDQACYNLVEGGQGFTNESGKRASLKAQDAGWFGWKNLKDTDPDKLLENCRNGRIKGAAINRENGTGMFAFTFNERSNWSSNYNSNRVWITNGVIDKRVKDICQFPLGYYVGRSNIINISRIGMKCWTNGDIHLFAFSSPGAEFFNGMIKTTPTAKLPWWNNGKQNKRSIAIPGPDFNPGRLKWKSKIVECTYCTKTGGETAMKRHHFTHCKFREIVNV